MLKQILSLPIYDEKAEVHHVPFWFTLSLFLPIYYGITSIQNSFSRSYIVQDDVRQHVFWMQQFVDPELFQNDLIAEYFRAIAPPGYKLFYYWMSQLGVEPLFLAKVLPLVIGLVASVYGFFLALELFPIPAGAFITSIILNQSLWLQDDITTSTPRAFIYPIFLAFLYYLLRRSFIPCVVALALQAVFYPQLALVEVGTLTLRIFRWNRGRLKLSFQRIDYLFWFVGVGIVLLFLFASSQALGEFGPIVTATQMRAMPEFGPHGRIVYFTNFWQFWLVGSGGLGLTLAPPVLFFSVLLPVLLKRRFPLTEYVSPDIKLLPQVLGSSFAFFVLAHGLLLKLYFPNRYMSHSLRVVMALAAGMVVTLLLEAGKRWLAPRRWGDLKLWHYLTIGFVGLFAVLSVLIPANPKLFIGEQVQIAGRFPQLYEYFAKQPKDSLIASLSDEANNLPTFSHRSVLVTSEYALPLHLGYYNQIRQRAIALIQAQYSSHLSDVQDFIQKYGVDFFVLERGSFRPNYLAEHPWLMLFQPAANEAIAHLNQKETPALETLVKQCSVLQVKHLIVLKADCVLNQS